MDSDLLLVGAGAGILLVRAGMALHAIGSVRSKNSAGMGLRQLCDLLVCALAFWAVGAAILHMGKDVPALGLMGGATSRAMHADAQRFVQMCAMTLAAGIVVGAVSERARFWPMLAMSAVVGGVVLPLAGYLAWGGWLARLGYRDAAGASVIHLAGAVCAASAAYVVGPRTGKFNRDGSSNAIPGHNVALESGGAMLMLVGWFIYVAAFQHGRWEIGVAATNVILAAATGLLSALLLSQARYGKTDIHLGYGGMLGALVASTAAAGQMGPWGAMATGVGAGLLVPTFVIVIDLRLRIDDPSSAIAAHGIGGAWGILAAGLFTQVDGVAARLRLLGVQATGMVAVAAAALFVAAVVLLILRTTTTLRAREADEFDGLDLAEHDIGAYPDFQQTMIKSYHLREM